MSIFHNEPTTIAEWRSLVLQGQDKAGVLLTEVVENYMVLTLDAFTTKIDLVTSVIAIDFLANIRVETLNHANGLRSVGDHCLILAGLFPDRAKRKRVSADYFMHIGQHAYYVLSYAARSHKIDHILFYQLFENFAELIHVLSAMRDRPAFYLNG